jgi:NTE family protein
MEELGAAFGAPGTLNTEYHSFERLHKLGQRATRRFLDSHFDDVGHRSTIDAHIEEELELVE